MIVGLTQQIMYPDDSVGQDMKCVVEAADPYGGERVGVAMRAWVRRGMLLLPVVVVGATRGATALDGAPEREVLRHGGERDGVEGKKDKQRPSK